MVTRNVDLRPVPLANITTMDFRVDPFAEITVTLFAPQFRPGWILNTVPWDGGSANEAVLLTPAQFADLDAIQLGCKADRRTVSLAAGQTLDLRKPTEGLALIGSGLNDVLTGGRGNDTITGGAGLDQMRGNGGADTGRGDRITVTGIEPLSVTDPLAALDETGTISLAQRTGLGSIDLGAGSDQRVVRLGASSVLLNLGQQSESLSRLGSAGSDRLRAGSGSDQITVGQGDEASGNGGADLFQAKAGFAGAARIDGGEQLSGTEDINLTTGLVDLSEVTFPGIERIGRGNPIGGSGDRLTITSAQLASSTLASARTA